MDFKRNPPWKLRLGYGLRRQRASHLALCCDRDSVVVLCLAAGCVLVPCPATILSHLRSTSGLEKTGGGTLWAVSLVNLLPLLTPSSRFDNDGTRYCQCHAYLRDNRPTPPLRMISPLPHCSLIQPVPLTGPRSKRECRGRPHLQGCDVCMAAVALKSLRVDYIRTGHHGRSLIVLLSLCALRFACFTSHLWVLNLGSTPHQEQ